MATATAAAAAGGSDEELIALYLAPVAAASPTAGQAAEVAELIADLETVGRQLAEIAVQVRGGHAHGDPEEQRQAYRRRQGPLAARQAEILGRLRDIGPAALGALRAAETSPGGGVAGAVVAIRQIEQAARAPFLDALRRRGEAALAVVGEQLRQAEAEQARLQARNGADPASAYPAILAAAQRVAALAGLLSALRPPPANPR